ncbi:sensor histidine kinase N-terminal domain-containing protein [Tianweitania sp. BSSL-BM11]|uniref:histidine kinase n=1 Tax=Tianweitania aestuarii TaxID=2814886 RepID=A0ABS5RRZ0_9HYPH|nr:ATP-binding protein [Tianweitania aestuarii]MBS9719570.1 sensor histidine kinase N-terminal domain-containing protein [Tianweitania aestuarii]
MSASFSMTRRLMIWLTLGTALFWLLSAGLGAMVMREEFDEVFDSALEETTQRLMSLLIDQQFQSTAVSGADPVEVSPPGAKREYLTYQLRDQTGRVLLHSHDAPSEPFQVPLRQGYFDDEDHRTYTVAALNDTLFLQVADPLDHRREAMLEGARTLVLPILGLIPASVLVIWLILSKALRPISLLQDEISQRGGGNLRPLGLDEMPQELAGISTSVDTLLLRLGAALQAERDFAAHSAHELRTPIAGALAQTQRLLAELPSGHLQARACQIEASLKAITRLSEKLLQLARADAGIGAAETPVDLVPALRLVVDEFVRLGGQNARLKLELPPGTRLIQAVDIDAFAIALRNLIENALRHGPQNEAVVVRVEGPNGVAVINCGPVVSDAITAGWTTRFKRGATSSPGSGLGLSIVSQLASTMGAKLVFQSPAPDRSDGLRVAIEWPG